MIVKLMNRKFEEITKHYLELDPLVGDLIFSNEKIWIVRARVQTPGQEYSYKMAVVVDEYQFVSFVDNNRYVSRGKAAF